MKKKVHFTISFLGLLLALSCICVGVTVAAAADSVPKLADTAEMHISQLTGFASDGVTVSADREISVGPNGRFGYAADVSNVRFSATVNFSTVGHIGFILRSQGETLLPIGDTGWTNGGYAILYYMHGQYEIYKNNALLVGPTWGPVAAFENNKDYLFSFGTIDILDETGTAIGVRSELYINEILAVRYDDMQDPILSAGWAAITSYTPAAFTVNSAWKETLPSVSPLEISNYISSSNFPLRENGINGNSVMTSETGALGVSGVAFGATMKGGYAIRTKVKPTAAQGQFIFAIGATKQNTHELNRPNIVGGGPDGWGWDETGYVLTWSANGQRHLYRNGPLLSYAWEAPSFEANRLYDVEYGYSELGGGINSVYFKVDGVLVSSFLDKKTDDYTPLTKTLDTTPAGNFVYTMVCSSSVEAELSFDEAALAQEKQFLTRDLGTPICNPGSLTKADRNGQLTFGDGMIAGYDMNFRNTSVVLNMRLHTVDSALIFGMRSTGVYDTPWGAGWTNKGYSVMLFPSGQIALAKNGITLMEGWATGGFGFVANTDYRIEVGTVDLLGGVNVYAKVNDTTVLHFLDVDEPLMQTGWFHLFSNSRSAGTFTVSPTVKMPVLSTADGSAEVKLGLTTTMQITGTEPVSVVYSISDISVGSGNITDNIFTATKTGKVYVYALADGIYTNDLELTVTGRTAVIENIPQDEVVLGGQSILLTVAVEPSEPIQTVAFEIVTGGTGEAELHPTTGEFLAKAEGTVLVKATVNGLETETYTITIVAPSITLTGIDAGTKLVAFESEILLGYDANVQFVSPVVEYLAVTNASCIHLQENKLTGVKAGRAGIVVIVNGYRSAEVFVDIIPIVRIENIGTMVVGEKRTLQFGLNCESSIEQRAVFTLVSGDAITLYPDSGVVIAHKVGTVAVKVTVNGVDSRIYSFMVESPTVILVGKESMITGDTQQLEGRINGNLSIDTIRYNVKSGSACLELNSSTGEVKAVKAGAATVTVTINGIESAELRIVVVDLQIEILVPAYIKPGSVHVLDYATNADHLVVTSVVYRILSGDSVSIDAGKLTANHTGKSVIQIVLNNLHEGLKEVVVSADGGLVFEGQNNLKPGREIWLSAYFQDASVEINSAEYEIVSGAEFAKLDGNKLTFIKYGKVVVRVRINGGEYIGEAIFETIKKPANVGLIIGICVGAAVLLGGGVWLTVCLLKRKNQAPKKN